MRDKIARPCDTSRARARARDGIRASKWVGEGEGGKGKKIKRKSIFAARFVPFYARRVLLKFHPASALKFVFVQGARWTDRPVMGIQLIAYLSDRIWNRRGARNRVSPSLSLLPPSRPGEYLPPVVGPLSPLPVAYRSVKRANERALNSPSCLKFIKVGNARARKRGNLGSPDVARFLFPLPQPWPRQIRDGIIEWGESSQEARKIPLRTLFTGRRSDYGATRARARALEIRFDEYRKRRYDRVFLRPLLFFFFFFLF